MKELMQKLAELEATAPKTTQKKMLREDSTTPPMKVANKPASLKDVFENMAMQNPIPVVGKQGDTQKTGAGFLNISDTSPAGQAMQKALTDLAGQGKAQIVMPTQPGQQTGQPNQAGATGQPQMGQMQMKEKDEGKPGKNFAKIAKSAGARYGSKEAGERVAGAVRAKLMKQGKLEEEPVDESALQAYLGDKKYGKDGMDALRKAGREHASKGKMANIRAKYDKMDEAQLDEISKGKAMQALQYAASDMDDHRGHTLQQKIGKKWPEMKKHAADAAYTQAFGRPDRDTSQDPDQLAVRAKTSYRMNKGGTANKQDLKARFRREVDEGDIPSSRGVDTMGAGLGAGRSATTLEGKKGVNPFAKKDDKAKTKVPTKGKKPDFLDFDKDGDKKEPMKKAVADKNKKKVKESMNHKINAARHEGKSHGLRGHAHSGKRYEDLEEMRAYHEGFKEGMDELYEMGMYETAPAATVPGMASQAMPTMEDEVEEGNAFTAALKNTPKGGKFEVGGKTFTDRSNYGENVNEYAFESLDQQLNALLNESEEVTESLSVSVSKGNHDSEDSVNINATGPESEELMAFVKNAGLGLFGDDNADTHSSAMSIQPSHGAPDEVGAGGIDIGVVDGHDGMMGLMQKLSGIQSHGANDYEDESDEEHLYGNHQAADKKNCGCDGDCECSDYDKPSNEGTCNEETCNECGTYEGMHEAGCSMGRGKEMVDEVESEDQMEFEVSEDNAPDSGEAESTADEDAEAKEDAALAGEKEEEMNESDDEEDDKYYDKDGNVDPNGAYDAAGHYDRERDANEGKVSESSAFALLFKKLSFIAEEATDKEDEKAEKAGKKVAKDIEHDEGHKGKDDDKAEKAGKKVTKDIEYDDKKDKGMSDKQAKYFGKKTDKEKVDEWANNAGPGKTVSDTTFEQDIDFMTKVISGGLNKQKSTGQTTIPVIAGQTDRMGATKEAVNESVSDWVKLAGIK